MKNVQESGEVYKKWIFLIQRHKIGIVSIVFTYQEILYKVMEEMDIFFWRLNPTGLMKMSISLFNHMKAS